MNTIKEFPVITEKKVTILKQNDMGFYYSMEVNIIEQGTSFYNGFPDSPFITYNVGRKKSVLMLSIIPSTVIAIYPGHFVIDIFDNESESGFCFDIEQFERMVQSIKVTPLFIYYKKDD